MDPPEASRSARKTDPPQPHLFYWRLQPLKSLENGGNGMLTVDDYATIRLPAPRRHEHSRNSPAPSIIPATRFRQILQHAQPKTLHTPQATPEHPSSAPSMPLSTPSSPPMRTRPPKQRHTAMQVFRRLREEHGFRGGYKRRSPLPRQTPTRSPRDLHPAGPRPRPTTGVRLRPHPRRFSPKDARSCPCSCPPGLTRTTLFSSWLLPTERTEAAVLTGLVAKPSRSSAVCRDEVWWDNPDHRGRARIFQGRDRRPNRLYAALASHDTFDPLFCMPASGNEKPYAENRVKVVQQQWATPVPRGAAPGRTQRSLPRLLRRRELGRTVDGKDEAIGLRFERDPGLPGPVPLPRHPFDTCVQQPAKVDKYQTVRFDRNRYSVPRACAFRAVTVKGYVERIEVVDAGLVVARHARSYSQNEQILDPLVGIIWPR